MAFYRVCGNYYGTDNDANSLKHYRTPGSKNGVRKYQYEDGTLTPAGRIHYGVGKGGASVHGYTDTGTKGDPNGAAGLAYKVGGGKGLAAYNNVSYRAGNAAKAVGKTASSMARDAGNWGKQAVRDASRFGQQAVSGAKNFAGIGTKKAAEEARNRQADVRERLSAENDKRIYNNTLLNQMRADKQFGPSQGVVDRSNNDTRINYVENQRQMAEAGREARAAQEAHDKSVAGRAEKAYNDARTWTDKALKDASDWTGTAASDVKGWGEQAVKDVGKAAKDAGDWVGERAKDVGNAVGTAAKDVGKAAKNAGDWVGERAKDVGNAVGTAAKNVGNWAGTAAKDVARVGGSAFEKGRNFITGLFGKKKKG